MMMMTMMIVKTAILHLIPRDSLPCDVLCDMSFQAVDRPTTGRSVSLIFLQTV